MSHRDEFMFYFDRKYDPLGEQIIQTKQNEISPRAWIL
jgi:uncharacterized lipoprotein YddW (UPF0748 family)